MQPNNVLDFPRLGYYFRHHLLASWKTYLLGILSIFGLLMAIPTLMLVTDNAPHQLDDVIGFYYFGLFFGGLLFTSMAFSDFSAKEKGIHFMMLPASQFEKFITVFLITTIGYLVVFHLAAYAALVFMQQTCIIRNGTPLEMNWQFAEGGTIYIYFAYIFLHAVFMLGAVSFSRLAFIKTLVTLLLCLLGLYLLNTLFVWILFGSATDQPFQNLPFALVGTRGGKFGTDVYVISEKMIYGYAFIAKYLLAPCIWTIAYFRLKDKEI
ncbi:hypothetical protein [Chitinophaga qingshengii]|uniref:ABC transporter permease n=1 Tax=Chitinophaga qingshengii TaxID=1569794 RepID=A0ABR7TKQ0_9BACT|nr:hypothetical protein [Chitinophaga qingshengii]MBC9931071.1 hypothetical protein [Chitinophaga qingshengii]